MPPCWPCAGTQMPPALRFLGGLAIQTPCDMEFEGLQFGDGGPRVESLIGIGCPKGFG